MAQEWYRTPEIQEAQLVISEYLMVWTNALKRFPKVGKYLFRFLQRAAACKLLEKQVF
jgi:hypothetical protein